jgi:hypothetical protein
MRKTFKVAALAFAATLLVAALAFVAEVVHAAGPARAPGKSAAVAPRATPGIDVGMMRNSGANIAWVRYTVSGRGFVPGVMVSVGSPTGDPTGSGSTWGYAKPDGTIYLTGDVRATPGTILTFRAAQQIYDANGYPIPIWSNTRQFPAP